MTTSTETLVARLPRIDRERATLVALDAIAAALALAAFRLGGEPDVLFHAVWVVLVIEAFLYGVRVSGPRIVIAASLVVVYSLVDGDAGIRPLEVAELLFTEWPLMFVIIVIVAIMADRVTRTSRTVVALERQTHEQLVTAREDERRRLSADLHDGLGQTLTALVLSLDTVETTLDAPAASPSAQTREALGRAQHIAELALEETRDVAHNLRPARMREMGLTAAIRDLAAHAGRDVEVIFDPRLTAPGLLCVEDELQAYRIVQEAIANAVRHGAARSIRVNMHLGRRRRLVIEVSDDGRGFDVHEVAGSGIGLRGMRERAAGLRGTLDVSSHRGAGTVVRLQVPLAESVQLG
ncbi:MAG: sensor histidine kinase [Chloroflexota bacterium]